MEEGGIIFLFLLLLLGKHTLHSCELSWNLFVCVCIYTRIHVSMHICASLYCSYCQQMVHWFLTSLLLPHPLRALLRPGWVNTGSHSPNNVPLHLSTPLHPTLTPKSSVTSIALNRQRFSGLHHYCMQRGGHIKAPLY